MTVAAIKPLPKLKRVAIPAAARTVVLKSDESYEEFIRFIQKKTEEVGKDRSKAVALLYATGMYDKNGVLKQEFE